MNKKILSTIALLITITTCTQCTHLGVKAEWDKPDTIIVHTPGPEVFCGLLHANAALFEETFDTYEAQKEHQNYIHILQKDGIEVLEITDILLDGTINLDGTKIEGPALDKLIHLAEKSLTYQIPDIWDEETKNDQQEYKVNVLKNLHPYDLIRIIFERPTLKLALSPESNTQFIAEPYLSAPLMNLHFLRDQQITTDKGVVLGKMNSTQRRYETEIMDFVFKKLGLEPIYRVTGAGRLEGGDYMPAGDFALIGQGLRTNAQGVQQLLNNNVFDFPEIAVVKDPFKHQDQMHLDTYFNILGNKKAIVDTIRRTRGLVTRGTITQTIRPTVDVYYKNEDGNYELAHQDVDFFEYMEDQKGFEILDITDNEQLNYGCNFLCIGDNKIVGVQGVSETYEERLKEFEVETEFMNFRNITKSYGGPHCTTQVISRTAHL